MTSKEEITEEKTSGDESNPPLRRPLDVVHVIEQFGGIRPMAAKIGVAVTTVQGWKNRAAIPTDRWNAITAAAAKHGVDLKRPSEDPNSHDQAPEQEVRLDTSAKSLAPHLEKATGGGLVGVMVGLALVVSLVAVAMATLPYWGPIAGVQVPALMPGRGAAQNITAIAQIDKLTMLLAALERDVATRLDELSTRIVASDSKLIQRIDAMETTTAAQGNEWVAQFAASRAKSDLELNQRLDVLEASAAERRTVQVTGIDDQGRLKVVEKSLEAALSDQVRIGEQLASAVAAMNNQASVLSMDVAAIRKAQHLKSDDRTHSRSAALTLALSGLEVVLSTGRPFRLALTALSDVSRGDASLAETVAQIDPFAATGAPTLAQLTRQYHELALVLGRRESIGDRKDWVGQTLDRIYDVVSWRQTGGPIDQVTDALAGRDLKGAVDILAAQPDLEPVARDWLSGARNRIAATTALDGVRARITTSQITALQSNPVRKQTEPKQLGPKQDAAQ